MSFKLMLLLIFICACGVKGDPVSPKDAKLPSVLENYPEIQPDQSINDTKKK